MADGFIPSLLCATKNSQRLRASLSHLTSTGTDSPSYTSPPCQQLLKHFYTFFFHFSCIHQLLLVVSPVDFALFFWNRFRWPSMVFFHKRHYFPVLLQPQFVLRHIIQRKLRIIILHLSLFYLLSST